jgi:flavin-dependent dehydrogenase
MVASARFDVAIVGAGPAGAAAARQLARAGCRVALLERSRFDAPRVGESLAPGVQPLLAELGVWPEFLGLAPLPSYGTRSAWGGPDAHEHSHVLTPYGVGWHVDRLAFDRMLAGAAVQAGADLRVGASVVGCTRSGLGDGSTLLQVAGSSEAGRGDSVRADLVADLVIDATGRAGSIARRLGARRIIFDQLVGIAAHFADPGAGERCCTLVETTPDGWWYSAPVARDRSVVTLMTDGDLARARTLAAAPAWGDALGRARLTRARFDGAKRSWGPRTFSAASQRLLRGPADPTRWLAVGDAALAVDPISGSGVVRALRTAGAAARAALAALDGEHDALAAYEDDRNRECTIYLYERASYYAMEQRWPVSPFWSRRAAAVRALENAGRHAGVAGVAGVGEMRHAVAR